MEIKPTLLRLSGRTVDMLRTQSASQRRSMASLADEILFHELDKRAEYSRKQELSRLEKTIEAAGKVT